jgi:hypothetical protein
VSLSLRDELRVVLSRDEVQLVRIGRKLTLRGKMCCVLEKKSIPCMVGADLSWENVIQVLETTISELPTKPAVAQVIISNHFMRYAMVPLSQSLSNEAEEIAYANHCFNQLYGVSAESWEIKLNQGSVDTPQLASAVDGKFLGALRALFARANVKLNSVQPQLMTAYNNCYVHLKSKDVWFVLFEQGSLCLGRVQQGRWSSVRTLKVGEDWLDSLPEILDREAYLSESNTSSDEIYLWAPEYWKVALPASIRWKIHKLQPVIRPSFAAEYNERFALAMCG